MKSRITLKKITSSLSPSDITTQIFLLFLTFVNLIFAASVNSWYIFVPVNIIIIVLIALIVLVYEKESNKSLKVIRFWYPMAMIIFIFKEVYHIIFSLNTGDWDPMLIKIDHFIFGLNPTEWIFRFQNSYLTEFLQIIYFLYYFVIIIYGLELYLWGRYKEFLYAVFVLLTGFYLSYIIYIIIPAAGPRFYLHDFINTDTELPGIFFTKYIRHFLNFAESIPAGVSVDAVKYVQRDAFPSAHTEVSILIAYLSHKIKSKSFYFYLPYCIFMIISTIYLRYHYVIDVIAGCITAFITIILANAIYKRTEKQKPARI